MPLVGCFGGFWWVLVGRFWWFWWVLVGFSALLILVDVRLVAIVSEALLEGAGTLVRH